MIDNYDELIANYKPSKGLNISKDEFIGLLNILESHGENIEQFYDVKNYKYSELCNILFNSSMDNYYNITRDDNYTYKTLLEYNEFIPGDKIGDYINEWINNLLYDGDEENPVEYIRKVTNGEIIDTYIIKTRDGYVKQIYY